MTDRPRSLLPLVFPALLVVGLAVVLATGALDGVSLDSVRARIDATGPLAPLAYVLLFSLLQPLSISAHLFLILAGLLWPPFAALPLGMVGLLGASSVSFGAARLLGRSAVQDRIPPTLAAREAQLVARGLPMVVGLRLVMFTFFPLGLLMGVTNLSWRDYLVGTAVGCLPVAAVDVLLAPQVARWLGMLG